MSAAFLVTWLMSVTDKSAQAKREAEAFEEQYIRAQTGLEPPPHRHTDRGHRGKPTLAGAPKKRGHKPRFYFLGRKELFPGLMSACGTSSCAMRTVAEESAMDGLPTQTQPLSTSSHQKPSD